MHTVRHLANAFGHCTARAGATVLLACGVLGQLACAPRGAARPDATPAAVAAPRAGTVTVTTGVRLDYLEWGGRGEPVLLLPGLYANADIYNDFAPRLTDRFRVVALSRRAHGRSDEPATGYELDTLVADIRAFLDSMRLRRVHLVGHSLAGAELTAFASTYPERVLKLVYLDAAADRTRSLPPNPVRLPEPSPEHLSSADAFIAFMKRHPYWLPIWSPAVEASLRASLTPAAEGGLRQKPGPDALGKIARAVRAMPPTYERVRAPVLSIHALADTLPLMLPETPAAVRDSAIARQKAAVIPNQRASIEQLRRARPDARIEEMPGVHHYVFIHRRDEVLRLIRDFLTDH